MPNINNLSATATGEDWRMTDGDQAWGVCPSSRYEDVAGRFRPVLRTIRESAVERDQNHKLPFAEIAALKSAQFTSLRLPIEEGGLGASLPELFGLLIELSAADPNITNALRAHFGFTEDLLVSSFREYRSMWLKRVANGETSGSGFSEVGVGKLGEFTTHFRRCGDHWKLNGEKYYTTGCLFADWITVAAADDEGEMLTAQVSTSAAGVTVLDDWDGFGQTLTASGTVRFKDVVVPDEFVNPSRRRFRYHFSFYQLVHVATLAGIGRAAASDLARLVAERTRVYSHGNADRAGADPQILQVVGQVRASAYAAAAITLTASNAIQRAYDAQFAGDVDSREAAARLADIEVNQATSIVTDLVLDATTKLFDALGASAVKRENGLDRYWRNSRVITSHNPRIYRDRIVGDFAVNGTRPVTNFRVGKA